MKKNSILLCLIFCILHFNLFAQKFSEGWEKLQGEQFDEAENIFQELIKKKKNEAESKYCLAVVFSAESFRKYNLAKAYRSLKTAEKMFIRLTPKEQKNLEKDYQISKESMKDLKTELAKKFYQITKKAKTADAFDDFISTVDDPVLVDSMVIIRDEHYYNLTKKENTYLAYRHYANAFPKSKFYNDAENNYEKLYKELYNTYASEGDYCTLLQFRDKYYDYPFTDSTYERDFFVARMAYRLHWNKEISDTTVEAYDKYIKAAAPKALAFVALQKILTASIGEKDWKKASQIMERYKPFFKNDKRFVELKKLLNDSDIAVNLKSIGRNINTNADEYAPVITADGKYLYFAAKGRPDNIGFEDIFVSKWAGDHWGPAKLVDQLSTSTGNEAPLSISADGNQMLLFSGGDIYESKKYYGGWTQPESLPINTNYWEADAFYTADGNALMFVSDRPGGIGNLHRVDREDFHGDRQGNTDIYVCLKTAKGWGTPINLGPTINTPYCDRGPFLHPDMKTLYFCSDGRGGLGKRDIYKSTRLSDTSWTQWSEPVNVGKSINTAGDDSWFRITTDGAKAYFSAQNDTSWDIYQFDLPNAIRPEPVATISGKTTDINNRPLECTVKWEDLSTGKIMGELHSDPTDGSYFIVLPLGKQYGYYADREYYYPGTGYVDLRKERDSIQIKQNIILTSIKQLIDQKKPMLLKNIFFDSDDYQLKKESYSELNRFADFLKTNNDLTVEISGHTDTTGTAEHNMVLSQKRADAVRNYLISQKCNADNLKAVGYGQTMQLTASETEQLKALNRRVEFKVVKK